jgi:hypothetical protein
MLDLPDFLLEPIGDLLVPTRLSLRGAVVLFLLAAVASAVVAAWFFDWNAGVALICFLFLWLTELWLYRWYRRWRAAKQVERGHA